MEDDLNFSKMEDDLNFFQKWKTTSLFGKRKDNLNFFQNGRRSKYLAPLLNSKPNPSILGLCTAQVMGFYVLYSFSIFSEQNLVCVAFRRTRACKGNKGNFDIDDSAIEVKLSDVLTEKRTHRRKRLSCSTTDGPHGSAGLWCCASYFGSLS